MAIAIILLALPVAGALAAAFGESRYDAHGRRPWWPGAREL